MLITIVKHTKRVKQRLNPLQSIYDTSQTCEYVTCKYMHFQCNYNYHYQCFIWVPIVSDTGVRREYYNAATSIIELSEHGI